MKTQIKNQIKKAFVILICSLSLFSCKKNETTINRPTATEFNALQDAALNSLKETHTFLAEAGTTFTSRKGSRIYFPPGTVRQKNGTPVTGNVTLEFIELQDAGNMAATKKTTMGLLPYGNKSVLISGGEFNINVKQNGNLLDLVLPISVTTPANLTDSGRANMDLFNGVIDAKGDLTWEKVANDSTGHGNVQIIEAINPTNGQMELHYNTLVSKFGWTNIDRFYSDPRPKTTMLVSVPEGYSYDNCALYIKYVGLGSSLARLDTYDPSTKLFSEHYGQIPIGTECHLIFCTEENGKWKYATKRITIAAGATYSVTEAEMTVASQADYVGHVTLLR